jgi:type II secretory pathway component GspD/PulD (secretin)
MLATHARMLALLALLAPAQQPPAQSAAEIVRLVDGGSTVELSVDGVSVVDFVVAVQPLLGVPVNYEPAVLGMYRINQPGVQRVDRAHLRDAFDGLLHQYDLWTWDDTSGGSTVIGIFKPMPSKSSHISLPVTAPVLTLQQVEAGPTQRFPSYTVIFTLQHVTARDLIETLRPMVDSSMESIRPVETGNQLLVTASRVHLLSIRDVLRELDVPAAGVMAAEERIAALEKQVAALQARLAKLEEAGKH